MGVDVELDWAFATLTATLADQGTTPPVMSRTASYGSAVA
jgi:hypothetical protein